MQIKDFRTIPLVAALIGASIGTVMYLRAPALYASSSTIRVTAGSSADPNSNSPEAFAETLAYAVPADARAATSVLLMKSGSESRLVRISHTAQDAKKAQEVVKQLVTAALNGSGDAVVRATVLEPPILPTMPQRAHGAASVSFGAGLGLLLGTAFVVRRRVTRARSTE